jgi:acetyltransferase-like isoleucine patch superfamily enzyme
MIKEFISSLLLYICNYWIAYVPFYAIRHGYYRVCMGFKIGQGSSICMGARFRRYGRVTIGCNCAIHENVVFSNLDKIIIKDCVVIGPQCYLHTTDHDVQDPAFSVRMQPIIIENHAFIGLQSTVLKGVTVGENAVVAARSLVTKSVQPSVIVAGVPAKPFGERLLRPVYVPNYRPLFR